jgi:DNA-binding XRE family transcriptional regulator
MISTALRNLGEDMKNARRRRRISTALMAKRANISRTTLVKIEKGDAGVSLGNYATVLWVFQITFKIVMMILRIKLRVDARHPMAPFAWDAF